MRLPGIPTLAFGVSPVLGVLAMVLAFRLFATEPLAIVLPEGVIPAVTRPTEDVPAQPRLSDVWTNSIGMKLIYIPPGTFMMGSPADEDDRRNGPGYETQHQVQLTKGFWMGEAEVTRSQFAAFVLEKQYLTDGERILGRWADSWHYGITSWAGELAPVSGVSWNDAQAFCRWLSEKERRRYRLPTEAQWEYACRAGTTTPFYTGETLIAGRDANFDNVDSETPDGTFEWGVVPAGVYPPNSWGLYNMAGNLGEWCEDRWSLFSTDLVTDPKGPDHGDGRVLRNGALHDPALCCRSAYRMAWNQSDWSFRFGFRVVMEPVDG